MTRARSVTRRRFLGTLGAAVPSVGGLARGFPAAPVRAPDLAPLSTTAQTFHEFVAARMIDADGLCRSWLCAETLRPWTNAQLADLDLSFFFQNAPDKAGCLTYENSLMSTGEFVTSQIVRFRVTGEASARASARRGVQAILAVAQQGRHYMPGYLPKPFGGLSRARDAHEISPDQYTKALVALHTWRPLADREQGAAIDQFFVDAADFFIARKFRHAYRHRTIVTAPTHQHALGLFVPLVMLAANVTGQAHYRQQLSQFSGALDAAMNNEELANFNMTSLLIEGFCVALAAGCDDPRLPRLVGVLWQRAAKHVDGQGRGYEGREPKQTAQATRLAAAATLVESRVPTIDATPLAIKILSRLTEIQQVRHYQPADAAKLAPSHRWLAASIDDTGLCSWLLAYWRLRERATG